MSTPARIARAIRRARWVMQRGRGPRRGRMPKRALRWPTLPVCAGSERADGSKCLRPEGWCCDEPSDFAGPHCVFWLPAPEHVQ